MADKDIKSAPLRIGVLIHAPVQLLDVSPVDLFGMLTKEYLEACNLPAPLVNLGIDVQISYISSTDFPPSVPSPTTTTTHLAAPLAQQQQQQHLAPLTASASLLLTTSISSPAVAPGTLDLILIPGPDPRLEIPAAVGTWLREHHECGAGGGEREVVIMSVCTGIFVLASSGLLEGRSATGPRALLPELRGKWRGTKWVDERWVRDRSGDGKGEVWSSGGITNGIDMVAAYLKEKYPGPLSDTVCMLADVGDRGREYGSGKMKSNGLWLWAILRAWWVGSRKSSVG